MVLFRHRKLLYMRKIMHLFNLRRMKLQMSTLSFLQEQRPCIDLQNLDSLTAEERLTLRQNNPEFPSIMFMTSQQKQDYFVNTNESYLSNLQKAPQRRSKTKKIVKFNHHEQYIYDPEQAIFKSNDWE